jgi:hypothetical protein
MWLHGSAGQIRAHFAFLFHTFAMFRDHFQGGAAIEVLSQQGRNPLENWKVCRSAATVTGRTLKKSQTLQQQKDPLNRVYLREIKGFSYALDGQERLQFPKDERKGGVL